jgi:hypothetical protein
MTQTLVCGRPSVFGDEEQLAELNKRDAELNSKKVTFYIRNLNVKKARDIYIYVLKNFSGLKVSGRIGRNHVCSSKLKDSLRV